DPRRVSAWVEGWQARGLVGLYDRPWGGRPPIFTMEEQQKVYEYLHNSPQNPKKIVEGMEHQTKKSVRTQTIKRLIKKSHIWQRIKQALAQPPAPHPYSRSPALIARLHVRESQGECALWYCDGTGFCLEPYLPYAWRPRGASLQGSTAS